MCVYYYKYCAYIYVYVCMCVYLCVCAFVLCRVQVITQLCHLIIYVCTYVHLRCVTVLSGLVVQIEHLINYPQ